ncbi:MAG: tRNA (guanosine(37)-N1)-methyltransferase TrmD [Clostridiales bacterium]|nr:tRNA (guanosine(37)-N1)-methyltransferase TrmD [Clostridiales bacterium]
MKFSVLTLFPEQVKRFLGESILGRAEEKGILEIDAVDIRDFSGNHYGKVDDTLFGGGTGMLMQCEPVYQAYLSVCSGDDTKKPHCIFMSPKGAVLTQEKARELSKYEHLVILCGHYEGIDQRVLDEIVDEDISIGDYVLTGGEVAACVVIDCISRMVDGVLPNSEAYEEESHMQGYLEAPQYTKPNIWHDKAVPEVMLSGNHAKIKEWKRLHGLYDTWKRRPDMLEKLDISAEDWQKILQIEREESEKRKQVPPVDE